jgi:hypothetical protein
MAGTSPVSGLLEQCRLALVLPDYSGSKAEDLAWLKITFSTDKSGENRVGSEAVDGAEVVLTPKEAEFADVLKAVKKAAERKAKE